MKTPLETDVDEEYSEFTDQVSAVNKRGKNREEDASEIYSEAGFEEQPVSDVAADETKVIGK